MKCEGDKNIRIIEDKEKGGMNFNIYNCLACDILRNNPMRKRKEIKL